MNAWHKIVMVGFLGALAASACTVTSGDDEDDHDHEGGTGGSAQEDGGTGGKAATGGGSSTGGGAATGGAAATDGGGDAGDICATTEDPEETCDACVKTKCCEQWSDCTTQTCVDEVECIGECTAALVGDAGVVLDDDLQGCVTGCSENGAPSVETEELVTCIVEADMTDGGVGSQCGLQCYGYFPEE